MRDSIHELDDVELDEVNGGSFLNTLLSGASEIASAVGGALKTVGQAAACQNDPFACPPP